MTATAPAAILAEDLMIPSDTDGIRLHLRRKRLASQDRFPADRTVLMMHGATYSSASLFDVAVDGGSFMDDLAAHGFDVYALDIRGYGGSTRPPEMDQPPEANPPLARTETAVRDLATAVAFILEQRQLPALNLVAMSWGGSVAGAYAARNDGRVAKLALVAPLWLLAEGPPVDAGGALGAYRLVKVQDFRDRWLSAAPADKRDGLVPPGWFDAWAQASLATDPDMQARAPGVMRAPAGAILDIREHWTAGRPIYDPGAIRVPVLLAHAEWDADVPLDSALSLFRALTGAPYRRWVEIGEGTHMVLMEKNRRQVFDAVRSFLEETFTPAG